MKKALIIANMLFASATVFGMQENSVKWKPCGSVLRAVQKRNLQEIETAVRNVPWIRCTDVLTLLYKHKYKQLSGKYTLKKLLWKINTAVHMEINFKDCDGETPLFIASKEGYEDVVKLLIDYDADVNMANNQGETPLFIALSKGYEDMAKLLIDHGADVNIVSNEGETPLSKACNKKQEIIAKYLVEHGAIEN